MPVSATTWDPNLGWDFQCHSHTHPYFDKITDAEIAWELEQANQAFIAHGYPPPQHHAYPYGTHEDPTDPNRIINVVRQYRLTGRKAWNIMTNQPITDWYRVNAAELRRSTPPGTWQGWINDCIAQKTLLVKFTHSVEPSPGGSGITPETLTEMLDYAIAKRDAGLLEIMTFAEAYDYLSTSPPPPPTAILVWTFDSVQKSIYTYAWPIFKARGLKATTYLVTGWVGTQADYITWAEIDHMRGGSPPPTPQMHVASIDMSGTQKGPNWKAHATVTIVDDDNAPVPSATVYGHWSGAWTGDVNGVTDSTGKVKLSSGSVSGGGTFTFTVTNVVKTNWVYNATKNVETSDTITLPP
jgi:peptidoglycan/xylan/chitin deacetylase (PgdA/CDA1 family)